MAESLAQHNDALALLGNTLATGAMLTVLITVLGPLSGAHFNPAVTISFLLRKEISMPLAIGYLIAQGTGAVVGTWLAHAMFEIEILQFSIKSRTGDRAMACGRCGNVWACGDHFGNPPGSAICRRGNGWALHLGGVLVHRFHFLRKSSSHPCTLLNKHFLRNCSIGRRDICCRTSYWRGSCCRLLCVAAFPSQPIQRIASDNRPDGLAYTRGRFSTSTLLASLIAFNR